jgi:predicted alpha/beta hydrolase family esterase
MNETAILILPGFGGSGPDHWQTLWQTELPNCRRVEQKDWDNPDLAEWMANLRKAIAECATPPLLVAHSLGCSLVAHLASQADPPQLAGALLAAPADVNEIVLFYEEVASFAPMPLQPLPWPCIAVSSDDDMYVGPRRAQEFADAWGCELLMIEGAGHINADSGMGNWPAGLELLRKLQS